MMIMMEMLLLSLDPGEPRRIAHRLERHDSQCIYGPALKGLRVDTMGGALTQLNSSHLQKNPSINKKSI